MKARKVIRLVHWNEAEAKERGAALEAAGYDVVYGFPAKGADPDAFVIDLGRLPSQGREVAVSLRMARKTRGVPIVFVDGDPEKVDRIRKILPDAVYTSWRGIRGSLRRARPRDDPVVPSSRLAGYSGTPLPRKLGIKPGSRVAMVAAPRGFEKTLGNLPPGVSIRRDLRGRSDLILWFVKSCKDLEKGIRRMGSRTGPGGLWILWPKKASGVISDLTQIVVRKVGLGNDLVDYKICAVDDVWSGLKFAKKRRG